MALRPEGARLPRERCLDETEAGTTMEVTKAHVPAAQQWMVNLALDAQRAALRTCSDWSVQEAVELRPIIAASSDGHSRGWLWY